MKDINSSSNSGVDEFKNEFSNHPVDIWGLEVCANGYESAFNAQLGGAIRVELCDNLAEGGTTPSYAQIALAKRNLQIEIWPIIRPRGGDFFYSDFEFELMKEEIKNCKSLGCDGVVIGILQADGSIDKERCSELIALANPLPVAFHRAFDMCNDMHQALEDLIDLRIVRVLSSGGATSARAGAETLANLVKQAKGRISIMPGAGINITNIQELIQSTRAKQFHASCKSYVPSKMQFRNTETKMGSIVDEYQYELTSVKKVKELVDEINRN
ncbi:copper homeostasis protein CutC [Pedobacter sp. MC2016-05]|uniref:copper homeostasis protein CutC n=1 Tax=Pedobacter sp. MC2016-05 TaxID=2994474 RepID=UPI002246230A|nr:copper homeostasis protein CutC [Pedobacter sp. MC2016-05]MCX2474473.1 copper homeostasis protein CutC [Pedobacter sp. MC2016-05]